MQTEIRVINSFSINGKGGNPAGVVLNADNFSLEEKQKIAAKAGFPETAFVSTSKVADYKLEFFTPLKQIPHCGHATIATFSFLKQQGVIKSTRSSKETVDGCRSIIFKHGEAFMEQQTPSFTSFEEIPRLLGGLNLSSQALLDRLLPCIVNTGNSFLIVPIKDEQTLSQIDYDRDKIIQLSKQFGLIGLYLYTPRQDLFDATTRMFAPFYGIDEEAATGMAAGPLAAYLYCKAKVIKSHFKIEQGQFMKPASPSLLNVLLEVESGTIQKIFAGGSAYVSHKIFVNLKN